MPLRRRDAPGLERVHSSKLGVGTQQRFPRGNMEGFWHEAFGWVAAWFARNIAFEVGASYWDGIWWSPRPWQLLTLVLLERPFVYEAGAADGCTRQLVSIPWGFLELGFVLVSARMVLVWLHPEVPLQHAHAWWTALGHSQWRPICLEPWRICHANDGRHDWPGKQDIKNNACWRRTIANDPKVFGGMCQALETILALRRGSLMKHRATILKWKEPCFGIGFALNKRNH